MPSEEARKRGIVWIVLLSITGVVLMLLLRPSPRIRDHATRIASANTWLRDYTGYFWKSDHEILAREGLSFHGIHLSLLDLHTGKVTDLPTINAQLNTGLWDTENWRISPDGQWLLARRPGRKGKDTCTAFALDGSRSVQWPVNPINQNDRLGMYMHWLPNSQQWAELVPERNRVQVVLHGLDGHSRRGAVIGGPLAWPLNITSAGSLFSVQQFAGHMNVSLYSVVPDGKGYQQTAITTPKNAEIIEVEPAPDGKQVAFLSIAAASISPMQDFFQPLFPFLRNNGRKYTLWISNTDGTGTHVVGSQRGEPFAGIQWTRDGKRLSFLDGPALYTIPTK